MKHHDELVPVYKEYKEKSGWSQSRFKKKNADAIEDYEQTVVYIKEHRKPFIVDGKKPTIQDLTAKSTALKIECNELIREHNVFITKRNAAAKHKKQVKQYLDAQHMKRENERSRQRKQTQQRKNYLE